MLAIVFFALAVVAFVVPFFRPVPRDSRKAGVLLGLAGTSLSLAMVLVQLRNAQLAVVGNVLLMIGTVLLGSGIRFAKSAWSDFDERRMLRRGEEYQAKLDQVG